MTAQTIALSELEWRTEALVSGAGNFIVDVGKHTLGGIKHFRILNGLNTIGDAFGDLLVRLHSAESIVALENATPEQRVRIATKFCEAHDKTRLMLASLRSIHIGFWQRYYAPKINAIHSWNEELSAHSQALKDTDAALIILSQKDQEHLLEALFNSEEPSEDLSSVFARK